MSKTLSKSAPRSFLRDVLSVSTSRVAVLFASLVTGIIVARFLGVEGKGTLTAILLVPQLVITIAEAGLKNSAAYHIGRETWPVERIVQTTLLVGLITGVLGLFLSICWFLWQWEETYSTEMVALAVLVVPCAVLYNCMAGVFLGLQRIPTYAVTQWGPGIGKFLGTLLFVSVAGLGVSGAVAAVTLSALFVSFVLLWKLSRIVSIKLHFHKNTIKKMMATGVPFAVVYFLMALVFKANLFLVQIYGGIEALGYYSLASNLAELLWQIPAVMTSIVFTRSAAAEDNPAFSRKVALLARLTLLLGIVAAVFAFLLAPIVIPLFYSAAFMPSADIFVALLPGVVAMIMFKLLRQDLSGRGKPWSALWVIIPMLIVLCIAGPIVIPVYGAYGAALMMSSVYLTGTLFLMIIYCQICKISLLALVVPRQSDFAFISQRIGW